MQISKSFTDERSGNAAVAAETVAHGGVLVGDSLAGWNVVELPDAGTLADPALLAVGGGNPNRGLLATVVYAKRPLGLELVDVFVGNGDLAERVYDDEMIFVKHELGSDPHEECGNRDNCGESELKPVDSIFSGKERHLGHEEAIENQSNNRPGEVALGSKDVFVIHASIIAGNAAVQEGK